MPDCTGCDGQCPELTAENGEAWTLIQQIVTQVRTSGMGDVTGFDYPAVKMVARDYGFGMSPAMWGKVRAVEMAMRVAASKRGEA